MKTTKEKIEVMQAFLDGKKVEFKDVLDNRWHIMLVLREPAWDWESVDYRIKNEPLECWVNTYKRAPNLPKHTPFRSYHAFLTQEEANGNALLYPHVVTRAAVHMREVEE